MNKFIIILLNVSFLTACGHRANNQNDTLQEGTQTMNKQAIDSDKALKAFGAYSQAMKAGNTIYLSGQLGINPQTLVMESGAQAQAKMAFKNLDDLVKVSGGNLSDIVKLNFYLVDLADMPLINTLIEQHFRAPYPARTSIGVKELPRGGLVEVDAVMVVNK
jgi:reactive intermediate/imine deaminase